MKIQFIKGIKLPHAEYNYVYFKFKLETTGAMGLFMNKTTAHYRYKNKAQLERIPDKNESTIYVVIQDNEVETFKTLLHELTHFVIFRFFFNNKRLHDLLDKIDNPYEVKK